jgi:S1-C subfamily serine protease
LPWCRINEVVAGSGAEQAGLKVGDIVKTIDGQPVSGFQDLVLLISQYRPNDTVTLLIDRNQEELEIECTLGDRATVVE